MKALFPILLACGLVAATQTTPRPEPEHGMQDDSVQLGNFSVSLTVKDIKASKAFYEKLDFKQVSGKLEQNWVVLKTGTTKIGLFQGMFEKNSLTFNPGWDSERNTPKDFQDVRELQRILKQRGLKLQAEADESSDGPTHFTLVDPDGNPILVDQFVPKPSR